MLPVVPKSKKNNYHMTTEEVIVLLRVAKGFGDKWELIMLFAALRGLRINEILHINVDDFEKDHTRLKMILCKSHIFDVLPLHPLLTIKIKEYISRYHHTFRQGYLFSWYTGRRGYGAMGKASACAMMKKIRRAAYELGYEGFNDHYTFANNFTRFRISMHSLRRWHEASIMKSTNNIVLLRDIMRYQKTSSVEPYVRSLELFENENDILQIAFKEIEEKIKPGIPGV